MEQAGVQFVAPGGPQYIATLASAMKATVGFTSGTTDAGNASAAADAKITKHAQTIDSLTAKIGLQKKQFDILTQELLKANAAYGAGSIQAQKKDLALQTLAQSITKNEHALTNENQALAAEKAALVATGSATAATEKETVTLGTQTQKTAKEIDQSAHITKDATQATDTLGREVQQTAKEVAQSGNTFNAWGEIVKGALRQVGQFAVQELAQAARATAGFVKDSIGAAGDFEAGMNKFQVVAGKDVDTKGLEKFHDLFIQLGRDLPVSTSEVQQAAIEMVSGGIDPAIVAGGALKQTLQFAAASGLSLADAAQTSAKFLAGWTSSAATTEEKIAFLATSTDTLTQAAAASSTTAAELRLGLFNVQGAAQALHASFRDTTATLALLAPAFESSAQAGTALNVFMTRLVPQTNKAKDAMAELGLITAKGQNLFFDTKGSFLGMSNAAQVLKDKLGKLTDERKIDLLHQLFGNDAMKVANLLMQDGAKGLEGMIAKMDKANGVQAAAAIVQRGYNTALENAKGSVEALQITIGEALLPVLADLLNTYIAPAINAVTEFATAIFRADDPLLALVQSVDALAPGLGSIIGYFTTLVTEGDAMNDFLTTTPLLFQGMVGAVQGAITVFSQLSSAFDTGGISGLIDALTSDISAALPDIEAALAGWGQALIDWITPYIPPMLAALNDTVNQAWAWVQEQAPGWLAQLELWGEQLGAWIAPYIPVALAALNDLVNQAWAWVKAQAPGWLDQLGVWGEQLGDFVKPYVPIVLDALGGLVDDAWAWVKDQAPGWFEQLKTWGNELVAWVAPMIPPALVELGKLGTDLLKWVGDQAAPLLVKLQDWAQSFVAWIPGATVKFLAEWPKMFNSFLDWIGAQAGPLLLQLGTWGVQFVEWIAPKIPDILVGLAGIVAAMLIWVGETAVTLGVKILQWAQVFDDWARKEVVPKIPGILHNIDVAMWAWADTAKTALYNKMIAVGTGLVDGLKKGAGDAWGKLKSYINGLADQLPEWFKAAYGIHSPSQLMADSVGVPIVQGIIMGIGQTIPALIGMVESLDGQLTAQFSHVSDSVSQQISDMVKDIQDKVKSAQDAVNSLVASGFGATASISRQVASNLGAFADSTTAANAKATADALAKAETEARAMTDPEQGAKYFEMRSKQILELASLQKSLATQQTAIADTFTKQQDLAAQADQQRSALAIAASDDERNAILAKIAALNAEASAQVQARAATQSAMQVTQQQLALIGTATDAEIKGFAAEQAASGSSVSDAAAQLREILNANLAVKGKTASLPGIDDPTIRALNSLLDKLTSPAASPTQIASSAQYINNTTSNSYNLGIQTNNSPQVLQQSYAVMAASAP